MIFIYHYCCHYYSYSYYHYCYTNYHHHNYYHYYCTDHYDYANTSSSIIIRRDAYVAAAWLHSTDPEEEA